jgi:hypothetical protein
MHTPLSTEFSRLFSLLSKREKESNGSLRKKTVKIQKLLLQLGAPRKCAAYLDNNYSIVNKKFQLGTEVCPVA